MADCCKQLGKSTEEDGPHLVYVPEKTFNLESFVKEVKEVYESLGRCLVAVSEGVHDERVNIFSDYAENAGLVLPVKKKSRKYPASGSGP